MINQQRMKLSDIIHCKVKDLSSLSCQPFFDLTSKALKFFELLLPQNFEQEIINSVRELQRREYFHCFTL